MGEYFGFEVSEEYEGQIQDFLWGIDPYYHKALVVGVSLLSQDQNEPVHDHYFTAIYGTIMEMEVLLDELRRENRNIIECDCAIADNQAFLKNIEAKD